MDATYVINRATKAEKTVLDATTKSNATENKRRVTFRENTEDDTNAYNFRLDYLRSIETMKAETTKAETETKAKTEAEKEEMEMEEINEAIRLFTEMEAKEEIKEREEAIRLVGKKRCDTHEQTMCDIIYRLRFLNANGQGLSEEALELEKVSKIFDFVGILSV